MTTINSIQSTINTLPIQLPAAISTEQPIPTQLPAINNANKVQEQPTERICYPDHITISINEIQDACRTHGADIIALDNNAEKIIADFTNNLQETLKCNDLVEQENHLVESLAKFYTDSTQLNEAAQKAIDDIAWKTQAKSIYIVGKENMLFFYNYRNKGQIVNYAA